MRRPQINLEVLHQSVHGEDPCCQDKICARFPAYHIICEFDDKHGPYGFLEWLKKKIQRVSFIQYETKSKAAGGWHLEGLIL